MVMVAVIVIVIVIVMVRVMDFFGAKASYSMSSWCLPPPGGLVRSPLTPESLLAALLGWWWWWWWRCVCVCACVCV